MKIRRADYPELGNWQILFESQEEAQAVMDYLDQLLTRGVVEGFFVQGDSGETHTGNAH